MALRCLVTRMRTPAAAALCPAGRSRPFSTKLRREVDEVAREVDEYARRCAEEVYKINVEHLEHVKRHTGDDLAVLEKRCKWLSRSIKVLVPLSCATLVARQISRAQSNE